MDSSVHAVLAESTPRLVDSLVHEVRNPLNALAINLEVLTDKLRQAAVLDATEKYLRAMRDQVFRIDGILRRFADFLSPRPPGAAEVPLSQVVEAAVLVVGHEARRRRVTVAARIEPNLKSSLAQGWSAYFLTIQPLLRAIGMAPADTEVQISLAREGDRALLIVSHPSGGSQGGLDPGDAMQHLCRAIGGAASVREHEYRVTFPLQLGG